MCQVAGQELAQIGSGPQGAQEVVDQCLALFGLGDLGEHRETPQILIGHRAGEPQPACDTQRDAGFAVGGRDGLCTTGRSAVGHGDRSAAAILQFGCHRLGVMNHLAVSRGVIAATE